MQANELRLGNMVYDDMNNMVKIDHQDIGEELYIFYNPIYLTEEILLKCGFEKVNKLFYDDNTYINLYQFGSCYVSLDNYTNVFFDWIDKSVMCYETMYLHQFQNLYFALTNQDLNVEL